MKTAFTPTSSITSLLLVRSLLFCAFLFLATLSAFAQEPVFAWRKVLHTGERVDITTDGASNVYATGWVRSGRRIDLQLAKFSSGGADKWFRFYSHPDGDVIPVAMVQDSQANTYVVGNVWPGAPALLGENYTVLVKYDSAGRLLWDRFYNVSDFSDEARSIAIDERTNEVVIAGTSNSRTWDDFKYFAAKYNAMGTQLWVNTGPGGSRDLVVDNSGNIYVACTTPHPTVVAAKDWTTIKYSPGGAEVWRSRFNHGLSRGGSATAGEASNIALDELDDVYIVGKDMLFMAIVKQSKTDGTLQWSRHEPLAAGDPNTKFPKIAVYNSNNVYVTYPKSDVATADVIRFDYLGSKRWHQAYTHPRHENIRTNDITLDATGNVYVAVTSRADDVPLSSVLKYDDEGNLKWVISPPDEPVAMIVKALHVDAGNNVYYAGSRKDATVSEPLEMAVKYTQPSSPTMGVVPGAFEPFDNFDFSAYRNEREWCWTDILIDWKVNPICLMPPICPTPRVSASLWSQGELRWTKQFEEPFQISLPDVKEPQLFKLALDVNQKSQDVIVLDDNLVSSGFSSVSLSALPAEKILRMKVETTNGESLPFSMTLFNESGVPIWNKEFMGPISEEINELLNEPVSSIKLSAIEKDMQLSFYPNPFSEELTVSIDKKVKLPAQVRVLSMQGKQMHQQTIEEPGNVVVNLKGQKSGLYILILKTQDVEVKELIELK
jgi:hypothetical protein